MTDKRHKQPSAADYERVVGTGATTEEVAERLSIPVSKALHGLRTMAALNLLQFEKPNVWRPKP